MNYKEARIIIDSNQKLIGKEYNGAFIEELICVPTDIKVQENFLTDYYNVQDGEIAIQKYKNFDVEVFAVFNKEYINKGDLFFYTHINNLK